VRIRPAVPLDARTIAALHADSWRRHYRGAYADGYLDGDIHADRLAVWSGRLADGTGSATFLAEDGTDPLGFVHVVLDEDEHWGSLVDNLHVTYRRQRGGIGTALLTRAARAVAERATGPAMYLWVLAQNVAAQRFYAALGGRYSGERLVEPPGGVPGRLNGAPRSLRISWPDAAAFGAPTTGS
jgi:ribosomal protein S18 acetylase RimI-like enzyme